MSLQADLKKKKINFIKSLVVFPWGAGRTLTAATDAWLIHIWHQKDTKKGTKYHLELNPSKVCWGILDSRLQFQFICVYEADCSSGLSPSQREKGGKKAEVLMHTQHFEAKGVDPKIHLLFLSFYQPNIYLQNRYLKYSWLQWKHLPATVKLYKRLASGNLKPW